MAKVCAHINDGAGQHINIKENSMKDAIAYFREYVEECRPVEPTMDIYFSGDCECDSMMNFHDYPDRRYIRGPRGSIRKEYI